VKRIIFVNLQAVIQFIIICNPIDWDKVLLSRISLSEGGINQPIEKPGQIGK